MDLGRPSAPARASDAFLLATFGGTAVAAAALAFILSRAAAALSPVFLYLLVADVTLAALTLLAIALAVLLERRASPVVALVQWTARHPRVFSVASIVLLGAAARVAYHAHPFSMDEYAPCFQSRIFAAGHLTTKFPTEWLDRLVPRQFQNMFLDVSRADGRVASAYWPGFALVLTPFSWAGVPWLCNPVLAGATLLVLAATMRRIAPDRPEAPGWAVLLTLASPAFFVLGISFYAMTALMLTNLMYTWGFISLRPKHLFCAGVVGSLALFLHNPFPHVLFALPWVVWLVWKRGIRGELLALASGYLPLSLLIGVGWMLVRASFQPAAVGTTDADSVFASVFRVVLVAFQAPDARVLYARLAGAVKLWFWAVPGLVVLAAWGGWRHRRDRYPTLLAASAVSTFAGYFIVAFDQGHGWGYRYFHSAWAALPVLGALALTEPGGDEADRGRLRRHAAGLAIASLVLLVPAQLKLVHALIGRQLALLPAQARASDGVRRLTLVHVDRALYSADLVQNDPFLRGHIRMVGVDDAMDDAFVQIFFPGAQEEARTPVGRVWRIDARPSP